MNEQDFLLKKTILDWTKCMEEANLRGQSEKVIYVSFSEADSYMQTGDDYRDLRETLSVLDAEKQILEKNAQELEDMDDGPAVWIGLAKAEIRRKELTSHTAENLFTLKEYLMTHSYFDRRALKKLYEQIADETYRISDEDAAVTPKPIKRRSFQTQWQRGDVYGFPIVEEVAKEQGLEGSWCLLWVAGQVRLDWPKKGLQLPLVYMMIWDKKEFPQNAEELQAAGYLQTNYHRSGRKKEEYRIVVGIHDKKIFEGLRFDFIGNFPMNTYPENELYIDKPYNYKEVDVRILGDEACYLHREYGIKHPGLAEEIEPPKSSRDYILFTDYTRR